MKKILINNKKMINKSTQKQFIIITLSMVKKIKCKNNNNKKNRNINRLMSHFKKNNKIKNFNKKIIKIKKK
jgi:hypothetical protein